MHPQPTAVTHPIKPDHLTPAQGTSKRSCSREHQMPERTSNRQRFSLLRRRLSGSRAVRADPTGDDLAAVKGSLSRRSRCERGDTIVLGVTMDAVPTWHDQPLGDSHGGAFVADEERCDLLAGIGIIVAR